MRKAINLFLASVISIYSSAQGTFSGDLMMNQNFFQSVPKITPNNALYNNYLSGSEGWLDLRYSVNGFSFFLRADEFNNSNLYNPQQALSNFGLGAWNVSKTMKDLTISVGYIYDQVGSGILFRSYEDRGLLIDNALLGVELKYKLDDHLNIKGFTGEQKNLFSHYAPIIKGLNLEGDYNIGKVHLMPGVGVMNRTLDQASINSVAATIQGYDTSKRFEPMYNTYAFTVYNTLTYKNLSWYAEGAYKTHEAIYNLQGTLVDVPGNIEYTSINYGQKGIALSLTAKRTENFLLITSPNENGIVNSGMLNWQPVVAVLRPERLMSLYTPASQNLSEMATTANLLLSPSDVTNISVTYSHINTLDNVELFREGYADISNQSLETWKFLAGVQYVEYNQSIYQGKAVDTSKSSTFKQPLIYALNPFVEVTYKINDRKSMRFEVSYSDTKQYYGSWVYGLLEYNLAPKFSISVSDMYNVSPNKGAGNPNYTDVTFNPSPTHYYSVYSAFTKGANRLSLAYVRQVAGINCSGGVCRYEPAFSGVKATLTSSF